MNRPAPRLRAALSALLTGANIADALAVLAMFAMVFGCLWLAAAAGLAPDVHQPIGAGQ